MKGLYEQEHFTKNVVPIRIFRHHYINDCMFTVNHWHRSVEINYIICGKIYHTMDGKSYQSGPGDLYLVNSGVIHANRSETDQKEIEAITLQISIDFLEKWMGKNLWFNIPKVPDDQEKIRHILNALVMEEAISEELRSLHQMELIYRLMAVLHPWCEPFDSSRQKEGLSHFKEVLDYIELNSTEELSLEILAKQFGYAPSYLSRAFKRYIGDNFHRHIQVIRLNKAVEDLRNHPEKTIQACAVEHGFCNVKSFINIFKEEYGCTPSEWRKTKDYTSSSITVEIIK